jgi:hypothetical protein
MTYPLDPIYQVDFRILFLEISQALSCSAVEKANLIFDLFEPHHVFGPSIKEDYSGGGASGASGASGGGSDSGSSSSSSSAASSSEEEEELRERAVMTRRLVDLMMKCAERFEEHTQHVLQVQYYSRYYGRY